jgi:hypothetical protein
MGDLFGIIKLNPYQDAKDDVQAFDQALAGLVQSGATEEAAEGAAFFAKEALAVGKSADDVKRLLPSYNDALLDANNAQEIATSSAVELTAAQKEEAEATEAAAEELSKWLEAVSGASTGFSSMGDAYQSVIDANIAAAQEQADKVNAANQKRAESDKKAASAATVAWEDFYDGTEVSVDEYIKSLQDQVDAQHDWEANLTDISERVRDRLSTDMQDAGKEMIDELLALGPAGAAQVALIASLSEEEFRKVVALYGEQGAAAAAEFATGLNAAQTPEVGVHVNTDAGDATYQRWLDGLPKSVTVDVGVSAANGAGDATRSRYESSLPKHARGTIANSAQVGVFGEDGPEAIVPLKRPLNRVDPSVRALSAFAQGLPQYADGGVFAPSGPSVVTVPVTSRVEQNSPINIGTLVSHDLNSFKREAQLQHRRRAGGGRRG